MIRLKCNRGLFGLDHADAALLAGGAKAHHRDSIMGREMQVIPSYSCRNNINYLAALGLSEEFSALDIQLDYCRYILHRCRLACRGDVDRLYLLTCSCCFTWLKKSKTIQNKMFVSSAQQLDPRQRPVTDLLGPVNPATRFNADICRQLCT